MNTGHLQENIVRIGIGLMIKTDLETEAMKTTIEDLIHQEI